MLHTTYDKARLVQNEMIWDVDFKELKKRVKIFRRTEICPYILAVTDVRVFSLLSAIIFLWKIAIFFLKFLASLLINLQTKKNIFIFRFWK